MRRRSSSSLSSFPLGITNLGRAFSSTGSRIGANSIILQLMTVMIMTGGFGWNIPRTAAFRPSRTPNIIQVVRSFRPCYQQSRDLCTQSPVTSFVLWTTSPTQRWQRRQYLPPRMPSSFRRPFFDASSLSSGEKGLFMSAMDDTEDDVVDVSTKDGGSSDQWDRTWNLPGLRKEISRQSLRCHKKIGKASQRLHLAQQEVDRLISSDVTLEELEACPNVDELAAQSDELQQRLKRLNQLEVLLQDIKGRSVVLPEHIALLAIELKINDVPPPTAQRGPKKEKGPRKMNSFRLPYRRFYTENKTEIRVGKQAEDNDELSLSPEHRDSLDWWMHASGCPGSHVVIRCHDQKVNEEVVQDAAALAARQSKCTGNIIKVSMTRARDIKKPPGAKAGLVQLTGQVRTVVVNMKESQARLDRLDRTVIIN